MQTLDFLRSKNVNTIDTMSIWSDTILGIMLEIGQKIEKHNPEQLKVQGSTIKYHNL